MKNLFIIFGTVFLAELGDKTQFAVLLFSTRDNISPWGVLLAASAALVAATALAVFIGERLATWVNPRILEGIAASGFLFIGAVMLYSVITKP